MLFISAIIFVRVLFTTFCQQCIKTYQIKDLQYTYTNCIIDQEKRGLCLDLSARHVVCVSVCLMITATHSHRIDKLGSGEMSNFIYLQPLIGKEYPGFFVCAWALSVFH